MSDMSIVFITLAVLLFSYTFTKYLSSCFALRRSRQEQDDWTRIPPLCVKAELVHISVMRKPYERSVAETFPTPEIKNITDGLLYFTSWRTQDYGIITCTSEKIFRKARPSCKLLIIMKEEFVNASLVGTREIRVIDILD